MGHTSLVAHESSQVHRFLWVILNAQVINIQPSSICSEYARSGKTLLFRGDEQRVFLEGIRESRDGVPHTVN